MFKAGAARHLALFERIGTFTDDIGGRVSTYVEVGRAFIRISPMGSFERNTAMKMELKATHWVYVRNCNFSITGDCRIRLLTANVTPAPPLLPGDRVFGVQGVTDPDEKGWQYRLMVSEISGKSF